MFRRTSLALAVLTALAAPAVSSAEKGAPFFEGPDIEPWTSPDAVLDVITDAHWDCSAHTAVEEFRVPKTRNGAAWDRIILQVESIQTGDPWDRLLIAGIDGTELLRATTPRTRMTLRKDITQYSAVLPQGELVDAQLSIGSYVGSIEGRMRLEFYADEPTADYVLPASEAVHGLMFARGIRHAPTQAPTTSAAAAFAAQPPARATIDLTTSGHGAEEFWFQSGPAVNVAQQKITKFRVFHVLIDGVEVASFDSMPYLYALLGFGNDNANTACVGPGNSDEGDLLHPLMWWTAQREADRLGVHLVSGEIPQYRLVIEDPEVLSLFTGAREVTVTVDNIPRGVDTGVWITSLSILLD